MLQPFFMKLIDIHVIVLEEQNIQIDSMLVDPQIKDLTPKVFHMIVVIQDVLDQWKSFFLQILYFLNQYRPYVMIFCINKVYVVIIIVTILVFYVKILNLHLRDVSLISLQTSVRPDGNRHDIEITLHEIFMLLIHIDLCN